MLTHIAAAFPRIPSAANVRRSSSAEGTGWIKTVVVIRAGRKLPRWRKQPGRLCLSWKRHLGLTTLRRRCVGGMRGRAPSLYGWVRMNFNPMAGLQLTRTG